MAGEGRPQRREAEIRAEFGTWTRGITGLETWGLTRRRGGAEEDAEKTVWENQNKGAETAEIPGLRNKALGKVEGIRN
jgi:hypothetical protein